MLLRLLSLLLLSWTISVGIAHAAAEPVTNGDVVKLSRAGLSEDTIRLTVTSAADVNFDTSPDALVALSNAGIPQSVIAAMIRRSPPGRLAAPGATGEARSAARPRDNKMISVLPPPITPVVGGSYYTRYNFWQEGGTHVTTNYTRGGMVPINTPVKLASLTRTRMVLELLSGERVNIEWVEGFTIRPLADVASELLGAEPVPIEKLGDDMARIIKGGQVKFGMTKEQVLMARGYPPRHVTPSLDSDTWVYWTSRFAHQTLIFRDGVLADGRRIR